METTLTGIFNAAATVGVGLAVGGVALAGAALGYWIAGPRLLKPTTQKAYVVTGYTPGTVFKALWPLNWFKGKSKKQFVVKDGPQWYMKGGSSAPEEVSLNTFSVSISKKDGEALTLKDHVKAEVETEFYIRVDKSSDEAIIQALQSFGVVNDATISKVLEASFDSALRQAAANMNVEEIHADREKFLQTVKTSMDLKPFGLELVDVALRSFRQAALDSFNENDYFDAQGLEKIRKTTEASRKKVNDEVKSTQTLIAERDKEEAIKQLKIAEQQEAARLAKEEEVARMTAEQQKRVAEIQAKEEKEAELAKIQAAQETEARAIEKARQIGLADEQKAQALAIAKEEREKASREAEIAKQKQVELAERDKQIALHGKMLEEAAAEKAANEKKAEAVEAEESVKTARQLAEAERNKKVEIIKAEEEAGRTAAGEKIAADAKVYVAQKEAEAAREQASGIAEALRIEAIAESEAAKVRAEGAYQESFQALKALADGKMAEAEAQRKLNEAVNALSAEARGYLIDKIRAEITPEIVRELTASIGKIDKFTVTSMDGVPYPGAGVGASGGGAAGGGANDGVINQAYTALLRHKIDAPVLGMILEQLGGDTEVTKNLPGIDKIISSAAGSTPAAAPAFESAANDNAAVVEEPTPSTAVVAKGRKGAGGTGPTTPSAPAP